MIAPDAGLAIDAGATMSPTEACERLAAATCALTQRCYVAFRREQDSSCVVNEQARCLAEYEGLRQSFERELVRIEPSRVTTCVQRMTTSACPPTFPPHYPAAVARPFADCTFRTGLLVGAVPAGETCVNPQECVAGTVCIKPSGVCRGVCSSAPKLGEPCAFGCGPGLVCGTDGKCARVRPLDAPCDATGECESDLICLGGTCRPRRKLGDSCAFDPAVPSTCEPGLACDVVPFVQGLTGTCVRPQPLDAPCRFHWSCRPGLLCSDIDWSGFPSRAPTAGTCRVPDDEGTACRGSRYAVYVGEQCAAGSSCELSTQVCRAAPTRGQPCAPSKANCVGVDTHCKPSGSGDTGTCTGPANLNEPCAVALDQDTTVSIPCAAGWCDKVNTFTCRPATKPLGTVCAEDAECMSGRCAVQPDRTLKCTEAC